MGREVLIDSNVYIDLLRAGRDPGEAIYARYAETDVVTCGIVRLEVLRGIRAERMKSWMEEVFSLMQQVATDNHLWETAVELAWRLDRAGRVLPAADLVIAACAMRTEAMIHTHDHHFSLIPGLSVVSDPL